MEKDFSFLHYLKTVTSDDQAYEGLSPDDLWLFYISETDVLGPFRQIDIIKLIPQFRHEFAPLKVCTVSQKEWKPFFNHSAFNKRDLTRELQTKTKFRKNELISDTYQCLVNGVKKGPYTQNQIIDLIESKEIKADVLISADQGMTWHRAYSYPQFNRRTKQIIPNSQIIMPDDAMEKTRLIVMDKIKRGSDSQDSGAMSAALLTGKNKHLETEKLHQSFPDKLQKISKFSITKGFKLPGKGKQTNPIFSIVLVSALFILLFFDLKSNNNDKPQRDPLEVLQGSKKYRNTSSKYEDQSPPAPLNSYEGKDPGNFRRKNDYQEQNSAENTYNDAESDNEQEDFEEDANEYDDSGKSTPSRKVSSTKKKPIKKLTISHQEDDPNEGQEENSDATGEEEVEDFELDE